MGSAEYLLSAGLEFCFAGISLILLIGCLLDTARGRATNRIMIVMLALHAAMNAVDACVWLWCDVPALLLLMKLFSFASYALGCAVLALFSLLLITTIRECATVPRGVDLAVYATGGLMAALWVLSLFNGMYYYWDENGICQPGDWFWLSQAFGVLLFLFDIALVVHYRAALGRTDRNVLILYSVIPLLSFGLVPFWDVTPFYMATTVVLLLYYIIIHVEHGQKMAEQETRLVRQELELTNSRTAMVLTQIRPHFLYNSLTAIAQLCEKDPAKAKQTTLEFSEYLRQNMNSLEQKEPIPFEKELTHVRNYLAIEQVRFGADLRIVYDIETTDFLIPPLSLQPIVENAVKHGVGKKEEGGTVTVATREGPDTFEVTVADDGIGFAEDAPPDGNPHDGLRLVRLRLEKLVGGSLQVESKPGAGTRVTLHIPKRREEHENFGG